MNPLLRWLNQRLCLHHAPYSRTSWVIGAWTHSRIHTGNCRRYYRCTQCGQRWKEPR